MAERAQAGERETSVEVLAAGPWPESRRLTELSHPHVAAVLAFGEQDGRPIVTKEVVHGRPIDQLVKLGRLELEPLLELVLPIVDGLAAAHELGVAHRDLRPANVLVDLRGRTKIVGFRLCPAESTGVAPHYRAPEQLRGREGDARSDVFSLGVILFELTTGVRPFDGHTPEQVARAVQRRKPLEPTRIDPRISPELSRIVTKALEKAPRKRYPSAVELRADLLRLQESAADEPEPDLTPGLQVMREGQRLVALGVGALLVLVVLWALFAGG